MSPPTPTPAVGWPWRRCGAASSAERALGQSASEPHGVRALTSANGTARGASGSRRGRLLTRQYRRRSLAGEFAIDGEHARARTQSDTYADSVMAAPSGLQATTARDTAFSIGNVE